MKKMEPAWMMYSTPPYFGDTLYLWERHLEKVRKWPDSVENKGEAIEQAEEALKWKREKGV